MENSDFDKMKNHLLDIERLNSAINLVYWDTKVGMPRKGVEYRGEVLGYLSDLAYRLKTSPILPEFIAKYSEDAALNDTFSAMLRNLKKEYEKTSKIPQQKFREYVVLCTKSEAVWEEAKEKSDFSLFQPYLEQVIATQKEFVEYWGYKQNKYDTLLNFYEPDITTRELDHIFPELRDAIVNLLHRIGNSGKIIDAAKIRGYFPKAKQYHLGVSALKAIGYDFAAGRLDESAHPFTVEMNPDDVRITTHYDEQDITSSLFSCIHEGGHGIYEQNISGQLAGTLLGTGVSMGIHESQSRLYENLIGRSKAFLKYFYPVIRREFPQFDAVDFKDFYAAVNCVEPSLIRTDADELTYSLHIIIRYEIEKMIFSDQVSVGDLPELWNEKYKEYLGVKPTNDRDGILQDTHWSDGSFGYFPSYALGNLYGAQFLNTMKQQLPHYEDLLEKGDLSGIKRWLNENIHRHGSVYTPSQLVKRVTGEELKADYFIDYLNEKYSSIYEL